MSQNESASAELVDVKMPEAGESVVEGEVVEWMVAVGDFVEEDQPLVDLQTAKALAEVFSPLSGTVVEILKNTMDIVVVGETLARIRPGKEAEAPAAPVAPVATSAPAVASDDRIMPAARRLIEEKGLDTASITATGPKGNLTKEDVINHIENAKTSVIAPVKTAAPATAAPAKAPVVHATEAETRVPMNMMRRMIAKRLVEAQQTAAILTTFNEVDMSGIMALRKKYQEQFVKRHGVKLGFMSIFMKACVDALKEFPAVNARIDGTDIVYHNYMHIGVAVGGGKGLVVPNVRHAEALSFSEIELEIRRLAGLARDNKIKMDDLTGGTFTISNGGVYGSMLSTPILNSPQTAILGMHNIIQRPIAVDGQVVIRPMMYLALSYDHRLIDGQTAVKFLIRIKECVENPERMLLEV